MATKTAKQGIREATVSWWPLSEPTGTRFDLKGANHLDIVSEVPPEFHSGGPGSDGYITLPSDSSLSRNGLQCVGLDDKDSFSISSWVRTGNYRDFTGAAWQIASKGDLAGRGYVIQMQGGSGSPIAVGVNVTRTWPGVVKAVPPYQEWVMITVNKRNGAFSVTLNDGPELTVLLAGGNLPASESPFRIGMIPGYGENASPSDVGQTAFFNRALTSDEIALLYNGGDGISYADLIDPIAPKPPCPRRIAAGRNTTNVVSEYTRDRVHYGVLYYPETQRLTDRLRAIIPECATVVSARWTTYEILTCVMSDPQIDGTDVSICIKAQVAGNCRIRSDVTLSNGQTLSMWHVITVPEAPFMPGDVWVQGPYFVEAKVNP